MTFHRQYPQACLRLLKKINDHLSAGGTLTRKDIDVIHKYRIDDSFVAALRLSTLVRQAMLEIAKEDHEAADRLLATRYAYSYAIANQSKIKRISGKPNYIMFDAKQIAEILISHKNIHGFLEKHLHEYNRYFSLKTLAKENIEAFRLILATPELVNRMKLKEIKSIARTYIRQGENPHFHKSLTSDNHQLLYLAKALAEVGDAAAMLYLANCENVSEKERVTFLISSANCQYLPAQTQLTISNYLGMNGIKTNEAKTINALVKCKQAADKSDDKESQEMLKNFFRLNPSLKIKMMQVLKKSQAHTLKQASIFSGKKKSIVKRSDTMQRQKKNRSS